MIIDLKLPDMLGNDLLKRMSTEDICSFPPVIVYTGRNLTRDEEAELRKYSRSIIIKGARSPERLLDEVTLFLHKVESRLSHERQRMLKTARSRDKVFEGRKVLLVDDDVRNIFALTSALEQKGAVVVIGRNGREAIERLNEVEDIDLVLMDVMMPEMDGFEATIEIRKDPRWRKLPIIAVTAKAMKDDQERCLQAGANDYLAKPIDLDRLLITDSCVVTEDGAPVVERIRNRTEVVDRGDLPQVQPRFSQLSGASIKRRVNHALSQFECKDPLCAAGEGSARSDSAHATAAIADDPGQRNVPRPFALPGPCVRRWCHCSRLIRRSRSGSPVAAPAKKSI